MNHKTPLNTPAPGRLLRLDGVENLTGLRKSSIYTYMGSKSHGFPTPVRIGARAVAWRESDVLAWIASRTDARHIEGGKSGDIEGIEGQRLAILCRLTKGPATVEQLTTDCNAPDPRARVHELRGDGHRIETKMIDRKNPDGSVNRVGLYVLPGASGQGGDK